MNIIFPINGLGTRFKNDNYQSPKPLINMNGEPIFFHILNKISNEDKIYIIYNKTLNHFSFKERIIKTFPNLNIIFQELNKNTKGAIETVLLGLDIINDDPILIMDCDTIYDEDIIKKFKNNHNKNALFYTVNKDKNPVFSYIKIKNKQVQEIKEKVKISNNACTGAYGFKNKATFIKYSKKIKDNNKEMYISFIYDAMLNDITVDAILTKKVSFLGTPEQLQSHSFNKKINKRICFDLDNTLVTYPAIKDDYTTVEPIYKNINLLKMLKKNGATIIIYTARRMKTHKGNVSKVIQDIGKITFDTLDKFDIPFDEIYFGKPYADFYIDDLGINAYSNLEKELGVYDLFVPPREFNNIVIKKNKIIKTTNNDGEIYFYNNVSNKKYFPKVYVTHNNTIEMEKIEGITLSHMYINNKLNKDILVKLLQTLNQIHSWGRSDDNIYLNYKCKLKERYLHSVYKTLPGSSNFYLKLEEWCQYYENNKLGKCGVIHGDPVFTNIILSNNKLKMIDMRGKLGNTLSIYGDINYDYAKVFQSIVGYDFILNDKPIDESIVEEYTNIIGNYIDLNLIKKITSFLLFSMLPLHTDLNKIKQYYELSLKLFEE